MFLIINITLLGLSDLYHSLLLIMCDVRLAVKLGAKHAYNFDSYANIGR